MLSAAKHVENGGRDRQGADEDDGIVSGKYCRACAVRSGKRTTSPRTTMTRESRSASAGRSCRRALHHHCCT